MSVKIAVFAPMPRASVKHGNGGEHRIAPQRTHGKTDVLPEFVCIATALHGSLAFFVEGDAGGTNMLQVAELPECFAPRGLGVESGRHQLAAAHLHVKGEFVVHLGGEVVLAESQPECATHRVGSARQRFGCGNRLGDRLSVALPASQFAVQFARPLRLRW